MIYYFAYGSNLHPLRLKERVPSAELVGVAKNPCHKLIFHKRGRDDSAKCNMRNTGHESDLVCGAIYKLNPEHKDELDRFEGNGYGYVDKEITLEHNGDEHTCFTYIAQQSYIVGSLKPYHWYKKLVIMGARYLDFPSYYISSIEAVESIEDPDHERRLENKELIERISRYR